MPKQLDFVGLITGQKFHENSETFVGILRLYFPGMLTKPEVNRGRGQFSRGQSQLSRCIIFSAKFYILTPFS